MPQRALIRPVGKMSAMRPRHAAAWLTTTGLLLLLPLVPVTSSAQEVISNVQLSGGAISSSQTLDVVENDGLTQATGQATGNQMRGGNDGVDAALGSAQTLRGPVNATVEI